MESSIRRPFRFAWSHQARLHRALVRLFNRVVAALPMGLKYRVGLWRRRHRLPYSLAQGATIVQIGAPWDTLAAGRSRAAYFALLAGPAGKVLVVEPYPVSCNALRQFVDRSATASVVIHQGAAWSERGEVELMIDPSHPATNFTSGTVSYDTSRLSDYKSIRVTSEPLDDIVSRYGLGTPDLVSITTNWAESSILGGMRDLLSKGVPFISLSLGQQGEDYKSLMADLGYDPLGYDDRGVTYRRRTSVGAT